MFGFLKVIGTELIGVISGLIKSTIKPTVTAIKISPERLTRFVEEGSKTIFETLAGSRIWLVGTALMGYLLYLNKPLFAVGVFFGVAVVNAAEKLGLLKSNKRGKK